MEEYDLVVVGSGPAGQKGAVASAKLGKRVAIVDRDDMLGGICLHKGTIPSKTLREAILYLSGFRQRTFYGKDYAVKDKISVGDLAFRVQTVRTRELEVVRAQLRRNGITVVNGLARFVDPHTLEVERPGGSTTLKARYVLIACGTRPASDPCVPLDGLKILNSDQLSQAGEIPRQCIVVGAGVIGLEYASMLTALGTQVTVIDQRPTMLDFVDRQMIDTLAYHMQRHGATFRLGEKVSSVDKDERGRVVAKLESGKRIVGDALLFTVGRQANADQLRLEAAGLAPDARGRIVVNENFQTSVPHLYAAGDVIGFPALASTSMEQGRLAACHMFGVPGKAVADLLPYGIYTIPEISVVGRTERQLTDAKVPYEVGLAKFDELAKGQMLGDDVGILKLLFDPTSLRLLGVHVIGENAAEIIHIGQAVLSFGGTIEYFRDTVFNYPTLAEAYKVAALNGLNKI